MKIFGYIIIKETEIKALKSKIKHEEATNLRLRAEYVNLLNFAEKLSQKKE